jgi:hypothetical protein
MDGRRLYRRRRQSGAARNIHTPWVGRGLQCSVPWSTPGNTPWRVAISGRTMHPILLIGSAHGAIVPSRQREPNDHPLLIGLPVRTPHVWIRSLMIRRDMTGIQRVHRGGVLDDESHPVVCRFQPPLVGPVRSHFRIEPDMIPVSGRPHCGERQPRRLTDDLHGAPTSLPDPPLLPGCGMGAPQGRVTACLGLCPCVQRQAGVPVKNKAGAAVDRVPPESIGQRRELIGCQSDPEPKRADPWHERDPRARPERKSTSDRCPTRTSLATRSVSWPRCTW